MKHTPGPWQTQERGSRFRLLVVAHPHGKGTEGICEMVSASPIRSIHNAKLIASAPELLSACKEAAAAIRGLAIEWSVLTDDAHGDFPGEKSLLSIQAAIEKAGG